MERTSAYRWAVPAAFLFSVSLLAALPVDADHNDEGKRSFETSLAGFNEVPSVSTKARGSFKAKLSKDGLSLEYKLRYRDLEGDVRQAHIHLGQSRTNGAVVVFLCQTATNPDPTGLAPECGVDGAEGVITADNIVAVPAQGIEAGAFDEVLRAIRAGAAYANVHTSRFPGGEVRGQIH